MRSLLRTPALCVAAIVTVMIAAAGCGGREGLVIGVASSVQDSGVLDVLVDEFKQQNPGIGDVKAVPGGSGQLLEMARRGELDVVIAHSPEAEAQFVADGEGIDRRPFMHNSFLLVGPKDDPAGASGVAGPVTAFKRIAQARAKFVSRGDQSGTHVRELAIWGEAGIDPAGESWYGESGVNQGANLRIASDKGAYTLTDSSTWTALEDDVDLAIYMTDTEAPNIYSVISVNPEKHRVNEGAARAFADFLSSAAGQAVIEEFGREQYGGPLFVPENRATAPASTP